MKMSLGSLNRETKEYIFDIVSNNIELTLSDLSSMITEATSVSISENQIRWIKRYFKRIENRDRARLYG